MQRTGQNCRHIRRVIRPMSCYLKGRCVLLKAPLCCVDLEMNQDWGDLFKNTVKALVTAAKPKCHLYMIWGMEWTEELGKIQMHLLVLLCCS